MLQINITKTLKHFQLNIDVEVRRGITGIIGPSGCGKSVTLQCLAGLQTPDEGEILLNGQHLYQSNYRTNIKAKDRKIGYVFQNYALFPHLTVEKNIEYGLKGKTKAAKKQMVTNMMKKVQLTGYEKHYPHQLSGGQQQRVALARTLVTEPSLLLLDEPFSALDHHVKHILEQELLNILKDNYSGIVILVTHNMEEAYRLCDHLILYDKGKVIQSGKKDEVFTKPINRTAAKVIGCKNILAFDSMEERLNHIECKINATTLKIKKVKWSPQVKHLGIYAEAVQFVEPNQSSENTFDFDILHAVKEIHHTNVKVRVANSFIIHASIPKKQFESLSTKQYKVKLSCDDIFLLTDD